MRVEIGSEVSKMMLIMFVMRFELFNRFAHSAVLGICVLASWRSGVR